MIQFTGLEEIARAIGISKSKLAAMLRNNEISLPRSGGRLPGSRGIISYTASLDEIKRIQEKLVKPVSTTKSARITRANDKYTLTFSEKGEKLIRWTDKTEDFNDSMRKIRYFFEDGAEVFFPDELNIIHDLRERNEEIRLLKTNRGDEI